VLAAGESQAAPRFSHVIEAIHADTAERLQGLATRTTTSHAWDDLVVAPDTLAQIKSFQSRVKHALEVYERWGFRRKVGSSTGASALFSGPPGTGKTMVAGLIARELGLQLYQVDLSKIVSKWVGETEKQLAVLFDAASAGHVMLLFDEADALFARRSTDVRSATDRYANLEVNYLLQRIDSFGGVSILTTNLEANLDEALRRRLSAHVVFYAPEEEERAELWRRLLVPDAPQAPDLDVAALARDYAELSGGHIKNAVIAAAFVAADEGRPIAQADLVTAARAEYVTLGRVLASR
jgi:SpoVK/Ycf46/Vps4 family AAA+-type ATPase